MNNDTDQPEYIDFKDLYLETSKSNRAKCNRCTQKIEKDVKRWKTSERNQLRANLITNRYYHEDCLPPQAGHPLVSYSSKSQTGEMRKLNKMPKDPQEIMLFQNVVQNYIQYRKEYDKTHNPIDDSLDDILIKKVKKENYQHQKPIGKNVIPNDTDIAIKNDFQLLVEKLKQNYKDTKIEILKRQLRKNGMRISGTRQEIFERVADAKLFGALPMCKQCGMGYPRYDPIKEVYMCPGYFRHFKKVKCGAQFYPNQIERKPWKI